MTRVYGIKENNTTHYIDLEKIIRIQLTELPEEKLSLKIFFNNDTLVFSSYNGYIGGLPKDSEKGEVIKVWITQTAEDLITAWKAYTPHIEYVHQNPGFSTGGGAGGPRPFPPGGVSQSGY